MNNLLEKKAFSPGAKNAGPCTKKSIAELRRANKHTGKVIRNIPKPRRENK